MSPLLSNEPCSAQPSTILAGISREKLSLYWELTKPRLSFLSIITAIVGYLVANPVRDSLVLVALILGTALSAGSAGVLNQWLEREVDARMARTRNRPLPSSSVSPLGALLWGLSLGVIGTVVLLLGTNVLATCLSLATILSYILVYTPLKQVTPWCTHIGAIPGALPPLIGWAAAEGSIGPLGWILFAMLFAWQIPHFMAIAWTYRDDYADANMPMLTVVDPGGERVIRHCNVFTWLLLLSSVLPAILGFCTWAYGVCALLSGGYFVVRARAFSRAEDRTKTARKLFFASIFYLPFILAALVLDRWLLI